MSDSGTVELSRDCGEEGTRHIPCRGQRGAERETILSELRCIDDSTENITTTAVPNLTSTKTTTVNIPRTTIRQPEQLSTTLATVGQSENMEDNTIPNLIFTTQHNGQEDTLMQADEPSPIKVMKLETKRNKKVQINDLNAKKVFNLKKILKMSDNSDEVMMGDQPITDELNDKTLDTFVKVVKKLDTSDEIMMGDQSLPDELLPLPHIKKSVTVDLDELTDKATDVTAEPTETTTQMQITTLETRLRRQTEGHDVQHTELTTSSLELTSFNEVTSSGLGLTEHPHNVVDESVDHFVPPMLLVRTKFNAMPNPLGTLTGLHSEENTDGNVQTNETISTASIEVNKLPGIASTTEPNISTDTTQVTSIDNHDSTTTPAASTQTSTVLPDLMTTNVPTHAAATTTASPRFRSPHAPQRQPDHPLTGEQILTTDPHGMAAHLPHHIGQISWPSAGEESLSTILFVTTTEASPKTTIDQTTTQHSTTITEGSGAEETPSSAENTKQSGETSSENSSSSGEQLRTDDSVQSSTLSTTLPKRVYGDLTNKDNFQPYKPNRHRSLTKPETQTYIKKLFG